VQHFSTTKVISKDVVKEVGKFIGEKLDFNEIIDNWNNPKTSGGSPFGFGGAPVIPQPPIIKAPVQPGPVAPLASPKIDDNLMPVWSDGIEILRLKNEIFWL